MAFSKEALGHPGLYRRHPRGRQGSSQRPFCQSELELWIAAFVKRRYNILDSLLVNSRLAFYAAIGLLLNPTSRKPGELVLFLQFYPRQDVWKS